MVTFKQQSHPTLNHQSIYVNNNIIKNRNNEKRETKTNKKGNDNGIK